MSHHCASHQQRLPVLLTLLVALLVVSPLASAFAPPAGSSSSSSSSSSHRHSSAPPAAGSRHAPARRSMTRPHVVLNAAGGSSQQQQPQQQAGVAGEIDVILCRHGQTDFNAENRCQGTSDVSRLTSEGQAQAAALGRAIAGEGQAIHRVFLSPLARARHTFDGMEQEWRAMGWGPAGGKYPTCAPTFLPDLQEIHLYSWQGHLREELKARHPEAFHNWYHDPDQFTVDGGYPVRELWARAKSAWATILSQAQPGERVLVVAHSGINQALCLAALGHGPGMYRRLNFVNCGAIHLRLRLPPSPEHAHKLAHRGGCTVPLQGLLAGGQGNNGGEGPEAAGRQQHHYRVVHPAEWEPEMHAPAVAPVEEAEMAGKR